MKTKKFNKSLYKEATAKVEKVMIPWLQAEGYTDIDSEENYGVDIRCMKDGTPHYFELELNMGWKSPEWPKHFELKIPYRKKKVVDKWEDGELTFVTFSLNCTHAWFMDGMVVKESPVETRDNRYVKGESFYIIDQDKVELKQMDVSYDKDLLINSKYPS